MIATSVTGDSGWMRVILASPPGNVLTLALLSELRAVIAAAGKDVRLKWLTIEGAGPDFSYGASIPEHAPHEMPHVLPEMHRVLKDLLAFPAPTAALVRGRCLGGGFELALACDDIIASGDAQLGLPEIHLAAFPPGAAALLPPRVGASRAARAMITGDVRTVAYWHEAGLLSMVAPEAALLEAAGEWFDRYFAGRSAVALAHAAEASRLTLRAQAEPALDAAEAQYLNRLLKTADAAEGVRAWIEKRSPQWQNR